MAEIDIVQLFPEAEKLSVEIDMLDFPFIESCSDWKLVMKILQVLRSGKEGHYPELTKAAEDKLMTLLPAKEKKRYRAIHATASQTETLEAEQDLLQWIKATSDLDSSLRKGSDPTVVSDPSIQLEEEAQFLELNLPKAQFKKLIEARLHLHLDKLSSLVQKTNKAEIERRKGNDCFKSKDYDGAISYYTNAIALHPFNESAWTNRAIAYLKKEVFDFAETDCTIALKLNEKSVKALIRRGMSRLSRGKYELAAQDFKLGLEIEPNNPDISKLLTKALERYEETVGKPLNLSKVPVALIANPPPSSGSSSQESSETNRVDIVHVDEIDALIIPRNEVFHRASSILTPIVAPSNADVIKDTQILEEGTGQFIRIQIEDEDDEAELETQVEDTDNAHIKIKIVEESDDDNDDDEADRLKEEGDNFVKQGNFAQAILSYDQSLPLKFSINTLNNRCLAKLSMKNYAAAISDADQVLQSEPENMKARFRRARSLFELGHYSEASKDMHEILKRDPQNATAKQLEKEIEDKVIEIAREASSRKAQDQIEESERLKLAGNDAMKLNEYTTAIEQYTRSISFHSHNLASYNNRSLAFLKLNNFQSSINDCTTVIEELQKLSQDSLDTNSFQLLKKAFYRRSEARYKLVQKEQQEVQYSRPLSLTLLNTALADIDDFLAMEIDNQQALSLRETILKTIESIKLSESTHQQATSTEEVDVQDPISGTASTSLSLHQQLSYPNDKDKPAIEEKSSDLLPSPLKITSHQKKSRNSIDNPRHELNLQIPDTVPKTLYEFERVWRSLHRNESKIAYLRCFKKSTFKKIFKSSMPTETLGEIVEVLFASIEDEKIAVKILKALAEIPAMKFSISLLPFAQLEKLKQVLTIIHNRPGDSLGEEFNEVFSAV